MILDRLKVIIEAETTGFKEGFREAQQAAQQLDKSVNTTNQDIKSMNQLRLDALKDALRAQQSELRGIQKQAQQAAEALNELNRQRVAIEKKLNEKGSYGGAFVQLNAEKYQEYQQAIEAAEQRLAELKIQESEQISNIQQTRTELAQLKEEIKNINKEDSKTSAKSSLFGSGWSGLLKRLVIMKALHSVLSAITSKVWEYTQYLVVADKKMGNLKGYNQAFSQIYTALNKVNISLAITVTELAATFAPAIEKIANGLTFVVEQINAMIAALQGKNTYTAVNPEYWEDYAEYVKEANSKLKETKHLISGFDEINVFSKAQSVFTTDQSPTIDKQVSSLQKYLGEIAAVGLALAAFKKLYDLIKKLLSLFGRKDSALQKQTGLTEKEAATAAELATQWALAAVGALGLAAALKKLYERLKELGTVPQPALGWVADTATELGVAYDVVIDSVKQKLEALAKLPQDVLAWEPDLSGVYYFVGEVEAAIERVKQLALEPVNVAVNLVLNGYETVKAQIEAMPQALAQTATQIVADVQTNADIAYNYVKQQAAATQAAIALTGAAIIAELATELVTMKNQASSAMATAKSSFAAGVAALSLSLLSFKTNMATQMSAAMTTMNTKLSTGLATAKLKITTWSTQTIAKLSTWATEAANAVSSFGTSFAAKIQTGLDAAMVKITTWASEASNKLASVWNAVTSPDTTGAYTESSYGKSTSKTTTSVLSSLKSAYATFSSKLSDTTKALTSITSLGSADKKEASSLLKGSRRIKVSDLGSTLGTTATTTALAGVMTLLATMKKLLGSGTGIRQGAFANGGVITKPTLGLVGEYAGASANPEIITPESKMKEIVDSSNNSLASVYIQVGRQIIQAIESKDLSVSISDDAIGRAAARANNNYFHRTGTALI